MLLVNGEAEMADECLEYQNPVLNLSRMIGIELKVTDLSSNSISSQISFVCQSTPIILNEEKCQEHEGSY